MLALNATAHEVNFNPINGFFGKQIQLNYMYPVFKDVAVGPLIGFQRVKLTDDADSKSINQWAVGFRIEKSPLGFDVDGFYSSIAMDLQSVSAQKIDIECMGKYKGYGGTFLTGYAIRENPYNIVGKFGAGVHTNVYLDSSIECDDGTKIVLIGIEDKVNLDFVLELSVGYTY